MGPHRRVGARKRRFDAGDQIEGNAAGEDRRRFIVDEERIGESENGVIRQTRRRRDEGEDRVDEAASGRPDAAERQDAGAVRPSQRGVGRREEEATGSGKPRQRRRDAEQIPQGSNGHAADQIGGHAKVAAAAAGNRFGQRRNHEEFGERKRQVSNQRRRFRNEIGGLESVFFDDGSEIGRKGGSVEESGGEVGSGEKLSRSFFGKRKKNHRERHETTFGESQDFGGDYQRQGRAHF